MKGIKRNILLLIISVISLADIFGATITENKPKLIVKTFCELPTDISARTNRVLDRNGQPCALIKVNVISNEIEAGKEAIETKKNGLNEYWVYLPQNDSQLSIIVDKQYAITVRFADFIVDPLEGNKTYQLIIERTASTPTVDNPNPEVDWEKVDADFLSGIKIMMEIDTMIGNPDETSAGGLIYHSVYERFVSQPKSTLERIIELLKEASDKGVPMASVVMATLTEDKVENEYYCSLYHDQEAALENLVRWKFKNQLRFKYPYSIAFYGNDALTSKDLNTALKEYNTLKSFFRGSKNLDVYQTTPRFGLNAAFLSSISNGILYTSAYSNEEKMSRWYARHYEMQYIFLALEKMWFNIVDECKYIQAQNPSMSWETSKESTREYMNYFVDFWRMDETIHNNRKK